MIYKKGIKKGNIKKVTYTIIQHAKKGDNMNDDDEIVAHSHHVKDK